MSFLGDGILLRRAHVLRAEAQELTSAMVALAEVLAGALEVHRSEPAPVEELPVDGARPISY